MQEYSLFIILQIVSKLGKFFVEIIPTFLMDSYDYGEFSYLYSLMIILSSFGVMGLHISLLRLWYEKKSKNLFFITGDIQLISFFLIIIISFFITNNLYISIVFILITFSFSLLQSYSTFFRVNQQIKKWFFFRETIFPLLVMIVLEVFYLFNIKLTLYSVLLLFSIIIFISVVLMFIFLYKFFKQKLFSFRNPYNLEMLEILKISLPMFFTGFTYLLLSRLDIIMLNHYIPKDLLGGYNVISRIAFQVLFFWQVVSSYFMPKIAKEFSNKNLKNIKLLHRRYLLLSIASTLSLSIVLIFFIQYFPIQEYLHNWKDFFKTTMYLILIGQFISVFFSGYGYFILYIHKEKLAYFNSIFMLVMAIILNFIFIPIYGINGAALATALTIFFTKILEISEIYYYKKTLYL